MNYGGDDLEDNFLLDHDLVALSGDEVEDDESVSEEQTPEQEDQSKAQAAQEQKKRKRKEKDRERKAKKRKLIENQDVAEPESVAAQPPEILAEYLRLIQAKTFSKLSDIELQDLRIPASCIADTTLWTGPRTLDQLGDFIAKTLPILRTRLSQRSKSNGAPTLIFVTGAALRVADVTRALKDRKIRGDKGGDVAKLFARHFKLEEHVAYLKRTKIGSAVGTPGRVGKLLCETDAISVSALTHIMLDVTFQDAKKRSMLDIPETRDEVFRSVLGGEQVRAALSQGKIQLVLF